MMKINFNLNFEATIHAIKYHNLPITYTSTKENKIELKTPETAFKDLKSILFYLKDLSTVDPHDLSIINDQVIDEIILQNKNINAYIKKIQRSKPNFNYLNDINMTLADLNLFYHIYILILSNKSILQSWFDRIQKELHQKIKIPILDYSCVFEWLDIRAGKIIKIEDHPDANKLYVETVLINDQEYNIVSGLKEHVKKDDLLNNWFLFVVNIKKNKIRGIESQGMILCVKSEEKIEPIKVNGEGILKRENTIMENYEKPKNIDDKILKKVLEKCRIINHYMCFDEQKLKISGDEVLTKSKDGSIS